MLRAARQVLLGIDLAQDLLRAALLYAPARARVRADERLPVRHEVLGRVLGGLLAVEDVGVRATAFHARLMPAVPAG